MHYKVIKEKVLYGNLKMQVIKLRYKCFNSNKKDKIQDKFQSRVQEVDLFKGKST